MQLLKNCLLRMVCAASDRLSPDTRDISAEDRAREIPPTIKEQCGLGYSERSRWRTTASIRIVKPRRVSSNHWAEPSTAAALAALEKFSTATRRFCPAVVSRRRGALPRRCGRGKRWAPRSDWWPGGLR